MSRSPDVHNVSHMFYEALGHSQSYLCKKCIIYASNLPSINKKSNGKVIKQLTILAI